MTLSDLNLKCHLNEGDVTVAASDGDDGVPWFPRHVSELDKSSNRVLELYDDHPVTSLALSTAQTSASDIVQVIYVILDCRSLLRRSTNPIANPVYNHVCLRNSGPLE